MRKLKAVKYLAMAKLRDKKAAKMGSAKKYADSLTSYAGHKMLSCEQANQFIFDKIESGEPFMAGRFGSIELLAITGVIASCHGVLVQRYLKTIEKGEAI